MLVKDVICLKYVVASPYLKDNTGLCILISWNDGQNFANKVLNV